VRIRQFNDVLLPRIREGEDMAGADDILDAIAALRRDLTVFGTKGLEETVEAFATRQRDTLVKLDELATRMDTIEARMEELHPQQPPASAEGGQAEGGQAEGGQPGPTPPSEG
jgi:hypothetical protein